MEDQVTDQINLKADADLADPLERVAYQSGMMLGLEAIRDEQSYHRRRLNRHQYWLHGYGTVAGMAVSLSHIPPQEDVEETVRIIVNPGMGIDGLGRDVLVNETYCINLNAWIKSRTPADLLEGYDGDNNTLWLQVTVRQRDCLTGKQPTLARAVNAGTDAVKESRSRDSILLELSPLSPDRLEAEQRPWLAHEAIDTETPLQELLSQAEHEYIEKAPPEQQTRLRRYARLMLAGRTRSFNLEADRESAARILLAHISIEQVTDPSDINVSPDHIKVNGMVRPFAKPASDHSI